MGTKDARQLQKYDALLNLDIQLKLLSSYLESPLTLSNAKYAKFRWLINPVQLPDFSSQK